MSFKDRYSKIMPNHLRLPVFLAVLLHFLLITIFFVTLSSTYYRMNDAPTNQQNIIQAKAIIEPQKSEQAQPVQQKQTEKKTPEEAEQQVLQAKTVAKETKIKEEKRIAALKAEKQKLALKLEHEKKVRELQKKKKQALEKAIALKKQQEMKKMLLAEKQKKLQNDLLQQQLKNEQTNLHQLTASAQKGIVDQYKAQILSLIQSNWRISQVNDQLECLYDVNLAPDGAVLSVKLVKSSGDSALDESARVAIFKSSPLPVPDNPALFSNFRHLMLTLSPKGYVQ